MNRPFNRLDCRTFIDAFLVRRERCRRALRGCRCQRIRRIVFPAVSAATGSARWFDPPVVGVSSALKWRYKHIHHFSDPTCRIYRAFGLPRGTFWQLASPRLWWRGFQSAVLARHGFSRIHGDGFRMPGVFLLDGGRVIAELRHQSAADRPDYLAIAADVPSASRAVSQSRGRSHRPSRIVES